MGEITRRGNAHSAAEADGALNATKERYIPIPFLELVLTSPIYPVRFSPLIPSLLFRLMPNFWRLFFVLSCLPLFHLSARAQSPESVDSTLNHPDVQHGIVLEFNTRISTIKQSTATINGLRLNWAMRIDERHQTFVGVAGYGLLAPSHNIDPDLRYALHDDEYRQGLAGAYGGIDLRYTYRLNAIFEIGGSVLFGPGIVDSDYISPQAFAVIEPGLEFVYRPTRFFAVSFGAGYRAIPSSPTLNPPARELSAFTGGLGLQFGWL